MSQLISRKALFSVAAIVALSVCTAGAPSLAAGGGVGSNSNGRNSVDRDLGRDRAADRDHRSTTNTNSNGTKAGDRDKGHDRASDRRSH